MEAGKVLEIAKNRYVLATVAGFVWIVFFDHYNVFKCMEDRRELHRLQSEKEYYQKQIAEIKLRHDELLTNSASMERFARERYFMKKDNEEVFILESPSEAVK